MSIPEHNDLRTRLGAANSLVQFENIVEEIRQIYEPYNVNEKVWNFTTEQNTENLILPPWLCQPYIRDTQESLSKKCNNDSIKKIYEDAEGNIISRKRMKKLRRIQRRPYPKSENVRTLIKCMECVNPRVTIFLQYFLI